MSRMMHRARIAVVWLSAILSFLILCLWSYTSTVDNLRLTVWPSLELTVNIQSGRMEWERTYAFKEEIPILQFNAAPIPAQRIVPRLQTVLGFGFASGLEKGYSSTDPQDNTIQLADYWILIIPLWSVLLIVASPFVLWLIRWNRSRKANTVGFAVSTSQ